MTKSKLIELIQTFTVSECRQFEDFVQSPFFNKNPDVFLLWSYIKKFYPDFPEKKIQKEYVFKKLFPKEQFDGKKMGYLMNYLLKLGEDFIQLEKYRQDSLQNNYYLMKAFLDRNLNKHFQFSYNKTQEIIKENFIESPDNYYYKHRITDLYSDFQTNQGGKNKNETFLQQASDQFDDYLSLTKIRYSCEMMNRTRLAAPSFDATYIDQVTQFLSQKKELPVLVEIYYKIFLLLKGSNNKQYFEDVLQLLKTNGGRIEKGNLRQLFLYLINISIHKIREGESQYLQICFNLYMDGISSEALLENGVLSGNTFTNTIRLGLMLKKFDVIEQFIQEKSKFLVKETQKDAMHYNLALLSFEKKNFGEVLFQLNQMPFSNHLFDIANKILLLKTYYESDDEEPLLSLIASFTMYLKRNKNFSTSIKKTNLNFCNMLNKILRRNPKKKQEIYEEIRTKQPLIEKEWLMQIWKREFA